VNDSTPSRRRGRYRGRHRLRGRARHTLWFAPGGGTPNRAHSWLSEICYALVVHVPWLDRFPSGHRSAAGHNPNLIPLSRLLERMSGGHDRPSATEPPPAVHRSGASPATVRGGARQGAPDTAGHHMGAGYRGATGGSDRRFADRAWRWGIREAVAAAVGGPVTPLWTAWPPTTWREPTGEPPRRRPGRLVLGGRPC
jgi:hypothetical protein